MSNKSEIPQCIEVFKISNNQGLEAEITGHICPDPLSGEPGLLLGFRVHRGDVIYDVMPQYLIFDQTERQYLDVAIHMIDPKTHSVLSRFAIDCDEFDGRHHTLPQLDADNERAMFITKNNYKIIRYSRSAINRMDDNTIIKLENTMYCSVFKRGSDSN